MKVQNIGYKSYTSPSFKSYDTYVDYEDDYGTYYNQISMKDAFISAGILSGILYIAGLVIGNIDLIKPKVKNMLNKIV